VNRALRLIIPLLGLALALAGCNALGNGDDRLLIEAEFDRAFNLFEGSRVRIVGVDVGRVEAVTVDEGSDRVLARISLDPGVEVPEDVHAAIIQGALLGERYIQLFPAYTEGPTLEDGATIPLDRTATPVEFEESFEALADALETLDPDEVARLVTNLAGTLDGQGESLGEMLESVRDLISTLRDSDEELVELARTLADLNETIGTRAEQIANQYVNLGLVAESLASERAGLRDTLEGLGRMTVEVGDLLDTHGDTLQHDVATITRIGRTIERNLDLWPLYLEGQAEVYRHAYRGVGNPERNWGWTRNHYDAIPVMVMQRIQQRLVGLCMRIRDGEEEDIEWEECMEDPTDILEGDVSLDRAELPEGLVQLLEEAGLGDYLDLDESELNLPGSSDDEDDDDGGGLTDSLPSLRGGSR
jgi:phospholipid/cholesterol/gamma-HCH transport system substrate-binding protein